MAIVISLRLIHVNYDRGKKRSTLDEKLFPRHRTLSFFFFFFFRYINPLYNRIFLWLREREERKMRG